MGTPAPHALDQALLEFFARGLAAPRGDAEFNALALEVFAWQFQALPAYQAYCQRHGVLPQRVRHWTEIPAVPAQAFKDVRLWGDDDAVTPPAAVFRTSGTTAAGRPGEHYMSAAGLALYDAALVPAFRGFVLPELERAGGGARSDLALLALGPPPGAAPHSSLWHMVDVAGRALFREPARWFLAAPGPGGASAAGVGAGLDTDGLAQALADCARTGQGACLVTTDLALDAFLALLAARGTRFALPAGSRLVHTGGTKGRRTALDPAELRGRAQAALGLAPGACVSEYGMTELASQFYTGELRARGLGPGGAGGPLFAGPPWIRACALDVHTLEPLPPGRPGILRFHDLANAHSAFVVQTEDFGALAGDEELAAAGVRETPPAGLRPFRLLGRAPGSEARGCSLDAEEALA